MRLLLQLVPEFIRKDWSPTSFPGGKGPGNEVDWNRFEEQVVGTCPTNSNPVRIRGTSVRDFKTYEKSVWKKN